MSSPGWWWWWEWSTAATHTTHILEPRYHLPANRCHYRNLCMAEWTVGRMDGSALLHSLSCCTPRCTSVFLLPAVLRCQKSLSPCLESEGGISVSIQSCVGGRRQTMNIRICGIELRVIFSAILLPHLPAPRAAELETNLCEI